MSKLILPSSGKEYEHADQYPPGTRVASRYTRRVGTVQEWPKGRDYVIDPSGVRHPIIGCVWVKWDDGLPGPEGTHAWRHQIHRA